MSLLGRYQLARDRGVTVANLVEELLRRNGDREVSNGAEGPFRLSELHAEVSALDAFLRRSVGLRPGQPVAIYRSNTRECFHWFLAVIRAGGIAAPLNPQLSLAEVRRILAESGIEVLVTDKAVFERKIMDRESLPVRTWIQSEGEYKTGDAHETLKGFLRPVYSGASFPPSSVEPSGTVAIFHTSGTSGFPKGAALSSKALLGARATSVLASLLLGPRDLALVALPWSHIMAVSIALYGLMAGVGGCFLDHFEVTTALEAIERYGITAVVGVPTMFARLLNSHPDPRRLASVRLWLSASDDLPGEVRTRLRNFGALARLPGGLRIPPVLVNGYGMVELGGLAMLGIDMPFLPSSGNICFPMPPFRIRVADEDGRPMRPGRTGECQIWRRGLSPCYWKSEEESRALLTPDGWLRTGDLATRNRLGLIRLVGRMKDVIKSGGYSVYAREIEEALLAHPAVARAAAFGLPHSEKGELPVAAVELHPAPGAGEEELLAWCQGRLAPYKAARRIWIVAAGSLPQNVNGKIQRRLLQDRFGAKSEG
jgi:long-chain acyl-CoA synthetase